MSQLGRAEGGGGEGLDRPAAAHRVVFEASQTPVPPSTPPPPSPLPPFSFPLPLRGELKEVVGKDWIDRQRRIVQQHAAAYQRTSWNKIFGLLTSAGLNADGKEGSVSRSALKERFRVFNATFEELHRSQCMWKIPDPELRSAVQLQIAEVLLPAYRAFVQRYT
ncbi:unnamed protein product [Closterium sp. NIES-53]